MSDFQRYLNQQRKDPDFAAEYEAQKPEYEVIRWVIAAELEQHMVQGKNENRDFSAMGAASLPPESRRD